MTNRISQAIRNNSDQTEAALRTYLSQTDPQIGVIYDAMRYAVLGGGKRIRPFLVLEFCRMYGGNDAAALPLACALEMVHCYSLIHDDLPCMDNDIERRGKPSCHVQFGESDALLAGDALLTYAFEVIAASEALSDAQIRAAVTLLARAAGPSGMVGGQILDLHGEKEPMDYETLLRMNRLKTGRLIRCACLLGCVAAGQTDTAAAERYADRVGLTFQLVDDLLDEGEEDEKTTFLTFLTEEEAHRQAREWTQEAVDAVRDTAHSKTLVELAEYLTDRQI